MFGQVQKLNYFLTVLKAASDVKIVVHFDEHLTAHRGNGRATPVWTRTEFFADVLVFF
jgi:hypothetical protein